MVITKGLFRDILLIFAVICSVTALVWFKKTGSSKLPATQIVPQHCATTPKKRKKIIPSTVIFDLNGVLFTVSKKQALNHIGFFDILGYTLSGKKMEDLEDKIFELLTRMQTEFTTYYCTHPDTQRDQLVPMHKANPMPLVMRDWMQGELSGQEIIDRAIPVIEKLSKEKFFHGSQEKKLVKKVIPMIFDPQIRAKMYRPIKSGIKLLNKCKNLGHKVYLCTNMDTEFIDLLKDKYPEIFELFDGMVVSADVRSLKPYASIYEHIITTFNLDPATCFFIDDQAENIEGANRLGFHGICCDYRHYIQVRNELRAHKVLPKLKEKKHVKLA